jgi:hypothetical protein
MDRTNLPRRKFIKGALATSAGFIFLPCNLNSRDFFTMANERIKSLSDVDRLSEALRRKILNSKAEVSAKGTTYYVSNRGNDSNDGRSPERPWSTLAKVSNAEFEDGDAVLFERGGLWRGSLITKGGVAYSSWGEGRKPKIYGSRKNYSVKEKWSETSTQNVYVFDEAVENDVGILVFNDGQAHSFKKVVGIDGFSGSLGELENDLEIYHCVNDKKIYLYSGSGNPADRFSSIEFCQRDHIVRTRGNNILIDNLCIKYGGAHGIGSGAITGLTVTNCEFGWIGGSIQEGTTRYGNDVEIWGSCRDYFVDHCHIYQVYDAGVTHQWKHDTSTQTTIMENVTYSNNLVEYCIYSFEYFLGAPNSEKDIMRNILIKDNICRNAGYGWGWQRPDKMAMHIQGWRHINAAENFVITGNIFDRSRDSIIFIGAREQAHLPKLPQNVYFQNRGGNFGFYGMQHERHRLIFDEGLKQLLVEKGIDEDPTLFFVD